MEIHIAFDPADVEQSDECWPAFYFGVLTLKFWALYKKHHVTNQHFRESLVSLGQYYRDMYEDESEDKPYTNIDEFKSILFKFNLRPSPEWLVEHWDYFNLAIQRKVVIKYKAMVEVEKSIAA